MIFDLADYYTFYLHRPVKSAVDIVPQTTGMVRIMELTKKPFDLPQPTVNLENDRHDVSKQNPARR